MRKSAEAEPQRKRHAGTLRLTGSESPKRRKHLQTSGFETAGNTFPPSVLRLYARIICDSLKLMYKTHHFGLLLNSSLSMNELTLDSGRLTWQLCISRIGRVQQRPLPHRMTHLASRGQQRRRQR